MRTGVNADVAFDAVFRVTIAFDNDMYIAVV